GPDRRDLGHLAAERLGVGSRQWRGAGGAVRWPALDDVIHLIRGDQGPVVSPMPRLPATPSAARWDRRLALAMRRIGRWRLRGVCGIEPQPGFQVAVLGFELLDA